MKPTCTLTWSLRKKSSPQKILQSWPRRLPEQLQLTRGNLEREPSTHSPATFTQNMLFCFKKDLFGGWRTYSHLLFILSSLHFSEYEIFLNERVSFCRHTNKTKLTKTNHGACSWHNLKWDSFSFAATRMDLEDIMVSDTEKDKYCVILFICESTTVNSRTKSRMVVVRDWGKGENRGDGQRVQSLLCKINKFWRSLYIAYCL